MFLFIYNVNFLFVDAKGGENMKIYICINNGGEKYENMKNLYAYIQGEKNEFFLKLHMIFVLRLNC